MLIWTSSARWLLPMMRGTPPKLLLPIRNSCALGVGAIPVPVKLIVKEGVANASLMMVSVFVVAPIVLNHRA